jgi:glycosyltransferase involved in cell wall biosynthesis
MKLLIISHTLHKKKNNQWFAYGPYVNEMRLWEKQVDKLHLVAPVVKEPPTAIELAYQHPNIELSEVPAFSLTSVGSILNTFFRLPGIIWVLFKAMRKADHIHLRCPGNMGLLGCVVQLFFPGKKKSAKYAGNWDPKAKQPLSYRFQKWILNNRFLSRNMQVMVYGHWPNSSKNTIPFFTATYSESKKQHIEKVFHPPFKALFVGGLTPGKDPLYALKLVHQLQQKGIDMGLEFYGEGIERQQLETYIATHNLNNSIVLKGNQSAEEVELAYKESHFLILPSKSEGWPKAVAEAMFWGCIPMATVVSCVPEMLGQGERGLLLSLHLENDVNRFAELLNGPDQMNLMSGNAMGWSRQFTLEKFEEKIKGLL